MSVVEQEKKESLHDQFYDLYEGLSEKTSRRLSVQREAAMKRFQEKMLPSKKDEKFRYFPLSRFYKACESLTHALHVEDEPCPALPPLSPEAQGRIVFLNGRFSSQLSSLNEINVDILPIEEAAGVYSSYIKEHYRRFLDAEKDPFALFNLACNQEGIFAYLDEDCTLEILDLSWDGQSLKDSSSLFLSQPRIDLVVTENTQCKLLYRKISWTQEAAFSNIVIDLLQEPSSSVTLLNESIEAHAEYEDQSWFFCHLRASLRKDAQLKAVHHCLASRGSRWDFDCLLQEPGARCELYGLTQIRGQRQSHCHVHMEHAAPHCFSSQLFKGLVFDKGHSSFEGMVYVHKQAQQTDAFQLNKHLLLSPDARAESKPKLEIFADDVKASHGSTVGQLDAEEAYYLRSRGIPLDLAQKMLVQGFCEEILQHLKKDMP